MKRFKKSILAVLIAAVTALSAFAFTACGGTSASAEITGKYLSSNQLSYTNLLPTYNYFTAVIKTQEITTYSDNTYCLTVTNVTYSNISMGAEVPTGEETWNDRGQIVIKYYGTCTVTEDPNDPMLLTIAIETPTRVFYHGVNGNGGRGDGYFDTANWTDAMTQAASTDEATVDGAAYLAQQTASFTVSKIVVSLDTHSFTYLEGIS